MAANNWKKGKLETATRYNYYRGVEYPNPPSPLGQIFTNRLQGTAVYDAAGNLTH